MMSGRSWRSLAAFILASVLGASARADGPAPAGKVSATGQVGIHVFVLQRDFIERCGLTTDETRRLVRGELERRGFEVVDLPNLPSDGQIRLGISALRYQEEVAAYTVQIELRERAHLERDPRIPATAVTWSRSHLGIGKTVSVCSGVTGAIQELTEALAKERQPASSGTPQEQATPGGASRE
jgi:hypothetical protein